MKKPKKKIGTRVGNFFRGLGIGNRRKGQWNPPEQNWAEKNTWILEWVGDTLNEEHPGKEKAEEGFEGLRPE